MSIDEFGQLWGELQRDPAIVHLDGFHVVKHALRFGARIQALVTDDMQMVLKLAHQLAPDITTALRDRVQSVDKSIYRQLAGATNSPIAGLAYRPNQPGAIDMLTKGRRKAPIVVLDNPRNLGNIGAVVRLAAGMGCAGVITSGDVDPWSSAVLRGAAGLHFAVPVARLPAISLLPQHGVGLDPGGQDLSTAKLDDDAVLVFGSERHGLSNVARSRLERFLAIPIEPNVSSYNLATSVAMVLYHWRSRRS